MTVNKKIDLKRLWALNGSKDSKLGQQSKSTLWKKTCSSTWLHLNPFSRSLHKARICCTFHGALLFYNKTWTNRFCLPAFSWSHIFSAEVFSGPWLPTAAAEGWLFPLHWPLQQSTAGESWASDLNFFLQKKKSVAFKYRKQKLGLSSQKFRESQVPSTARVWIPGLCRETWIWVIASG